MARDGTGHIFCCCAIPLLNTGIYLSLLEQLSAGILIGTLLLAAPPVVGVSVPTFTIYLLAGLLYLTSLAQILGFFGVSRESTSLFRTYTWINTSLVLACFACAAALIGVSAARHSQVVSACEASFFPQVAGGTTGVGSDVLDGEGQSVCNIFAWVDIGLLGGLWLLLAIFQGYLLLITSFYARDQLADHKHYYSIYSTQDDILLSDRPGQNPWDTRASLDEIREPDYSYGPGEQNLAGGAGVGAGGQYGAGTGYRDDAPGAGLMHQRSGSEASQASTIRGEPFIPPTSPPRGGFGQGYNPGPRSPPPLGPRSPPPGAGMGGYGQPQAGTWTEDGPAPTYHTRSPSPPLPAIPGGGAGDAEGAELGREPRSTERRTGVYQGDIPGQMGRFDRP